MEPVSDHLCAALEPASFAESELEQSLADRFSAQVDAHRSCLAVRDPTCSLTYGELDAWANGIGHALVELLGPGREPVPLVFRQGAASTAAILGVLKAGRPYVSFDPTDPRAGRLAAAVGARVVLTARDQVERARPVAGGAPLIVVDDRSRTDRPRVDTGPDEVAYVFFTSGSTGEPKGVYDNHRNVLHNVLRYTTTLRIAPTDRLSLIQSPAFSGCVSSLFSALLNGAALMAFPFDGDLGALASWLRDQHVSIYHSVPGIYRGLLESRNETFPDIRLVRLEGDRAAATDVELHRRHFGPGSVLVNGLGTTETGLVRQLFVDRDTSVEPGVLPIGYSVRDMTVLVTDEQLGELEPGATGEIVVAGRYLALGYWGRPDLTAERFVVANGRRMYRTGDLGRMRDDGCLEYLGRLDGQLKVLGNRVEPAEVEAELVRIPGVREAAVTTRAGRRGEGRLIAFVVPTGEPVVGAPAIRAALRRRVPSYMVPSQILLVDELPVGPSGKLDRRTLAAEPGTVAGGECVTDEERLVARVWSSVLELEPIGRDDDFLDLGGDSLAAAEIVARLESETGVALDPGSFLAAPTVASLAALLSAPRAEGGLSVLAEGPTPPLVFCHGLYTGNTFLFAPLARHVQDLTVWAIDPPIAETDGLDEIVARHLAALRAMNRTGPYILVGHCSGGIVARELALRLQAAGEAVELLVILGISPIDFPELLEPEALGRWSRGPGRTSVRGRIRSGLAHTRALPVRQRPGYLANRARAAARRLLDGTPPPVGRAAPSPYSGRVALVLAEETTSSYTADPAGDWRRLAREGVEVLVLPGGDRDMMDEPLVEELAEHLRRLVAGSAETPPPATEPAAGV